MDWLIVKVLLYALSFRVIFKLPSPIDDLRSLTLGLS